MNREYGDLETQKCPVCRQEIFEDLTLVFAHNGNEPAEMLGHEFECESCRSTLKIVVCSAVVELALEGA